jgi:hypothetical protein
LIFLNSDTLTGGLFSIGLTPKSNNSLSLNLELKNAATTFYQKKLNSKLKTYSVSTKKYEQLKIKF